MSNRHCRYCYRIFQLSRYHPHQLDCGQPDCQRQRRREYHRRNDQQNLFLNLLDLWREALPNGIPSIKGLNLPFRHDRYCL